MHGRKKKRALRKLAPKVRELSDEERELLTTEWQALEDLCYGRREYSEFMEWRRLADERISNIKRLLWGREVPRRRNDGYFLNANQRALFENWE